MLPLWRWSWLTTRSRLLPGITALYLCDSTSLRRLVRQDNPSFRGDLPKAEAELMLPTTGVQVAMELFVTLVLTLSYFPCSVFQNLAVTRTWTLSVVMLCAFPT